jgi:hypothetical protein
VLFVISANRVFAVLVFLVFTVPLSARQQQTRAGVASMPSATPIVFIRSIDRFLQRNSSPSEDVEIPYALDILEPLGYDISVALADVNRDAPHGAALIFGYRDEANHCAVAWFETSATARLVLLKRSEGELSPLGQPADLDSATEETVSIEVRGDSLDVKVDGVSRITATDAECGEPMMDSGPGAEPDGASDDPVPTSRLESVSGDNQDTRAPLVSFTTPTSKASYSTMASTVDLSVSPSDDGTVTSCRFVCTTCAPRAGLLAQSSAGAWFAFGVGLAKGVNSITATCVDAAGKQAHDALTVTRTNDAPAGDSAPPTIVAPPNFTATAAPARVTGTARDNVFVTRVRWTCDRCPSGTAVMTPGKSVSWTATVALAPGANVVTFIAEDAAGNRSGDPVTVTYKAKDAPAAPVTIAWDWEGSPATRFRLWCNGAIAKNFPDVELTRKAMGNGVTEIRATLSGLKGTLQCAVSAYETVKGKVVESDLSNAITVNFGGVLSSK